MNRVVVGKVSSNLHIINYIVYDLFYEKENHRK